MPLIDPTKARQFAELWIDAWNRHDLDAVLPHDTEVFQFSPPLIFGLTGEVSGILKGKSAARAYWEKGLQQNPDLQFQLLDVLTGIDQITLYYQGRRSAVTESFQQDGLGKVSLAKVAPIVQTAWWGLVVNTGVRSFPIVPGEIPCESLLEGGAASSGLSVSKRLIISTLLPIRRLAQAAMPVKSGHRLCCQRPVPTLSSV